MELSREVKAALSTFSKTSIFNASQFASLLKLTLDAIVSMQEVGKSIEGEFCTFGNELRIVSLQRTCSRIFLPSPFFLKRNSGAVRHR